MKTRFYKILYKGKDVVYVGVTTRTISERFQEHVLSKSLNFDDYTAVEFACIEHPEITSTEIYYNERNKIVELERKYIKEELDKGSRLLNISSGGEWGASILNKLREEDFIGKFGSYEGYKEHRKKRDRHKIWMNSWCRSKTVSRYKRWVGHWMEVRTIPRYRKWLRSWIGHRTVSRYKKWLNNWSNNKTTPRYKRWLGNWVKCKKCPKYLGWLRHWVANRSDKYAH